MTTKNKSITKMGNLCSIKFCGDSKRKNPNIRLFRMPENKERQTLWLTACKLISANKTKFECVTSILSQSI